MYESLDRELWGYDRGWDGNNKGALPRGRGMLVVSWHAFTLGATGNGKSGLNKCGNIGLQTLVYSCRLCNRPGARP
jgi:hypothetical protein